VEHSLFGLMVAAAGAAVMGRAGELEAAKTFSPLQLIIDDEIAAILGRLRQLRGGLSLEEEATAWEDILAVPPGGHFLETGHTLRHCREALQPRLFVRQSRDAWAAEGETTLIDRARDRFRQLIAAAGRPEVDSGTVQAMESIVTEADRALVP
jgi:trimethylamine---corrinoid protein Co-methyltransferase